MNAYKSPICSCLTCRKEYSQKGIHSHYLTAHTAEGNARSKAAGIIGKLNSIIPQRNTLQQRIDRYDASPVNCIACKVVLPYTHKSHKFCSSNCSTKYNNSQRLANGYIASEKQRNSARIVIAQRAAARVKFSKLHNCKVCDKLCSAKRGTCSNICKSKILSDTAKNNPMMGGNKNTRAHGWYESMSAGKVWLESSYEFRVAVELDTNGIKWIRPKYLPYNNTKKYFADFYLTDYDIYLDPKNDYLISVDHEKIQTVMTENGVTILVLNKHQLTWSSILARCQ